MKYTASKDWQKIEVTEGNVLQVHWGKIYVSFATEKPIDRHDGLIITNGITFNSDSVIWVRTAISEASSNSDFVIQKCSKEILVAL